MSLLANGSSISMHLLTPSVFTILRSLFKPAWLAEHTLWPKAIDYRTLGWNAVVMFDCKEASRDIGLLSVASEYFVRALISIAMEAQERLSKI